MLTRLWKSKRSISFGSGSFTYDLNNCIMGDIPPWCWFFCRRKDAELWTRLDIFSSSGLNQKSPSEPVGGRSQHHQRLQLRHFRIHLRSGSGIIEQAVLSAQTALPPLSQKSVGGWQFATPAGCCFSVPVTKKWSELVESAVRKCWCCCPVVHVTKGRSYTNWYRLLLWADATGWPRY